jgi:thiol-disulfide isomerase/thioredoxin
MIRGTRILAAPLLAVAAVAFPAAANVPERADSNTGTASAVLGRFTADSNSWFNSAPLSPTLLSGKVVLVNFWTYSCINSLRALPYTRSWAAKYKHAGLVVIGVHTPEFRFEHEPSNVAQALRDLDVAYPIVMDNDYRIWNAFSNEYWPALYLLDVKGHVRYHYFGEGDYDKTEHAIQGLLKEGGATAAEVSDGAATIATVPVEAAPDWPNGDSPETYVGYQHGTDSFASPQRLAQDAPKTYSAPTEPSLNHWGLGGSWKVGAESATLLDSPGKIVFRFHSRDLHLVLGPTINGKPVRFKVTLDGAAPNDDHGLDSAKDGTGEVRESRLYQLIRQKGQVADRTFEVEFLDPGVHAYVFTFG